MKLIYHKGKNFGDALNPLIFEKLLPEFFNQDPKEIFMGIGSILGLQKPSFATEKAIVFSSGFGGEDPKTYGSLPTKEEMKKYDFRCVRGPLTAASLGLPAEKAICDGAILLPEVYPLKQSDKKYSYSYMPHVGSLNYYRGWKELMESLGINFINPTHSIETILEEINSTEVLLTEAMHGAIVADTLRVPWLPVKTKKAVNGFKWKDFCLSLGLEYKPFSLQTLYDFNFMKGIIKNKTGGKIGSIDSLITKTYLSYQNTFVEKEVKKAIGQLKKQEPCLSKTELLKSKQVQLLESLRSVDNDYNIK